MNSIVILITKIASFFLRLFGRNAGNVPGRIALKLNPHILDYLKISGKIVVITGTNGKTTTTNILGEILQKSNQKVIWNRGGNNINWGITTTLLRHASLTGKITCDYLLLETDEHWVPVLFARPNFKIDTLVILDFFRDQLDRAGEMETIIEKLEKFVKKRDFDLILNGDDPNVVRIGRAHGKGHNYYYGIAKLDSSYRTSHDKMEGIICPYCKTPLEYKFYQYSHLGRFKCPQCGYQNAPLTTEVTQISGSSFYLGHEKYTTTNASLYNIYNLLAIITFAKTHKISPDITKAVFATYEDQNGRYQTFHIQGKTCVLNLCKNPTGYNVVLRPLKHSKSRQELLLVLNDHVNDGYDVSWIWDIDFSEMGQFSRIICSGTRAYDMAIPLKCNGYDPRQIIVRHDVTRAIHELLKTDSEKYIISNYSPLVQVRKTLEKLEDKISA